MQRSILLPTGTVLLAAGAFIAGRFSNDTRPAETMPATPPVKSAKPSRSSGSVGESVRSSRQDATATRGEGAEALLNQLAGMSVAEDSPRSIRPVLVALEQLSRMGPKALPEIRRFLATGKDVRYLSTQAKRLRDVKSMANALVPPTLRFALLNLVAQTGGDEATAILAENLESVRQGLELAYLSDLLEQIAPGRYRDATISAATRLLANQDAADRGILFELMRSLGDTSYVATANRQMIQPNGRIDRDALRYLQQSLGTQSVALAARTYNDPRLVEPGSKEPLARVALSFVGSDAQALELFHTALLDPSLQADQKRELVEDLNQDGLENGKSPTQKDLQVITKRYELTQAYLQQDYVQGDPTLNAAFREADKDLRKMLERAAANPPR